MFGLANMGGTWDLGPHVNGPLTSVETTHVVCTAILHTLMPYPPLETPPMPLQMQMHPLQWPAYTLSHNLQLKGLQTSYKDIS